MADGPLAHAEVGDEFPGVAFKFVDLRFIPFAGYFENGTRPGRGVVVFEAKEGVGSVLRGNVCRFLQ